MDGYQENAVQSHPTHDSMETSSDAEGSREMRTTYVHRPSLPELVCLLLRGLTPLPVLAWYVPPPPPPAPTGVRFSSFLCCWPLAKLNLELPKPLPLVLGNLLFAEAPLPHPPAPTLTPSPLTAEPPVELPSRLVGLNTGVTEATPLPPRSRLAESNTLAYPPSK